MLARLPLPLLVALVAAVAVADVVVSTGAAHAVDPEVAPMPVEIPARFFATGPRAARTAQYEGLTVHLERGRGDKLAIVFDNPGEQDVQLRVDANVVKTEGPMASRMGPMAFTVARELLVRTVPAGGRVTHRFEGVDVPAAPAGAGGLALSFVTMHVDLGSEASVVFSEGPRVEAVAGLVRTVPPNGAPLALRIR